MIVQKHWGSLCSNNEVNLGMQANVYEQKVKF